MNNLPIAPPGKVYCLLDSRTTLIQRVCQVVAKQLLFAAIDDPNACSINSCGDTVVAGVVSIVSESMRDCEKDRGTDAAVLEMTSF